eukprot:SAG31_NODE_138_length_22877_cov_29.540917_4_plen_312_part_00
MSGSNQYATAFLVSKGADIEAVDTYGFTPLHRMASNNLAFGAKTLLDAGADPLGLKKAKVASVKGTPTPLQVAQESRARDVIAVLKAHGNARRSVPETAVSVVEVLSAGYAAVVGKYTAVDGRTSIPVGFEKVCIDSGWNTQDMWSKLNGGEDLVWFKHESNDSYLYFNNMDRHWCASTVLTQLLCCFCLCITSINFHYITRRGPLSRSGGLMDPTDSARTRRAVRPGHLRVHRLLGKTCSAEKMLPLRARSWQCIEAPLPVDPVDEARNLSGVPKQVHKHQCFRAYCRVTVRKIYDQNQRKNGKRFTIYD